MKVPMFVRILNKRRGGPLLTASREFSMKRIGTLFVLAAFAAATAAHAQTEPSDTPPAQATPDPQATTTPTPTPQATPTPDVSPAPVEQPKSQLQTLIED